VLQSALPPSPTGPGASGRDFFFGSAPTLFLIRLRDRASQEQQPLQLLLPPAVAPFHSNTTIPYLIPYTTKGLLASPLVYLSVIASYRHLNPPRRPAPSVGSVLAAFVRDTFGCSSPTSGTASDCLYPHPIPFAFTSFHPIILLSQSMSPGWSELAQYTWLGAHSPQATSTS